MLRFAYLLLAIAAVAAPASVRGADRMAADGKGCEERFIAADLDNDGALSASEIGNAQSSVPSSLAGKERVTRAEFMAACTKGRS
jgi:hypothetical protein